MMCLKKLSDLHLQRNQLTGTLEQVVTNGWRLIYGLDLSDNLLSSTAKQASRWRHGARDGV